MKAQLAVRLLAEQMGWESDSRIAEEFAWLSLLVEYKYDHYQGYTPGSRFFVSLLSWIAQFPQHEREMAYSLVKDKLAYISQREMHHLVSLTMPRIQREVRKAIALERDKPFYLTWADDDAKKRILEMSLRTLYIGLSDGAKIDVFRRENEGTVSNEQVVGVSEISDKKWDKLREELATRLKENGLTNSSHTFERICLIDDFTASGSTLIRKEVETGAWKGKVPTFIEQNIKQGRVGSHIAQNCIVHVHHYIGSAKAREKIKQLLHEFQQNESQFCFHEPTFSMVLDQDMVIDEKSDPELVKLLQLYYGASCEDAKHTGNGIWLGYKQCGLPLILEHNTPNNSIALLWAISRRPKDDQHVMKPLFPRKQRHIDHGQSI